jgi:hypothetical protein
MGGPPEYAFACLPQLAFQKKKSRSINKLYGYAAAPALPGGSFCRARGQKPPFRPGGVTDTDGISPHQIV